MMNSRIIQNSGINFNRELRITVRIKILTVQAVELVIIKGLYVPILYYLEKTLVQQAPNAPEKPCDQYVNTLLRCLWYKEAHIKIPRILSSFLLQQR